MFESIHLETSTVAHILFFAIYGFCAFAHFFAKSEPGNQKPLEPIIFAKSLGKIKYSTFSMFKTKQYTELTMPEFLAKCGLQGFTDTILARTEDHKKIRQSYPHLLKQSDNSAEQKLLLVDNFPSDSEIVTRIEDRLLHPLSSLVISEIDPEVGRGLFLAHDAEPILKHTILGLYAGEYLLKSPKKTVNCVYMMGLMGSENKRSKYSPHINAQNYGNFTRFMQDLPCSEEIEALSLPDSISQSIASENVEAREILYKGISVMYFIAKRDIKPGEQIGFSYRGDYWKNDRIKMRCLFDHGGQIIGRFTSPTHAKLNKEFQDLSKKVNNSFWKSMIEYKTVHNNANVKANVAQNPSIAELG